MAPRALSTVKAARECGVHYTTIRRWILRGELPAYETPGGHMRILKKDIAAFITSRRLRCRRGPDDPLRVLVVDDEEEFREGVVEFLNGDERFRAQGAADGFAAGHLVATFQPDVVIMDLLMPGMNGFDACRNIRSSKRSESTRILVLTAFATEENIRKAKDCGADVVVAKPVELDELKAMVWRLAEERAAL